MTKVDYLMKIKKKNDFFSLCSSKLCNHISNIIVALSFKLSQLTEDDVKIKKNNHFIFFVLTPSADLDVENLSS